MIKKRLIVIGAGGHGRAVAEIASMKKEIWDEIVFLDDIYPSQKHSGCWEIIEQTSNISKIFKKNDEVFVAIGNQKIRKQLIGMLKENKYPLANVIHPHAWVSMNASIGQGVAVMAGAVVGFNASLGDGVIVNANATVDHDVTLKDYAHIGVGVQLAGGVYIGEGAWLQAGVCAGYSVVVEDNDSILPGTALIKS